MELEMRIMNGADELFCRFGIKNVTMDDIARHLGMSKKTIYQHFEDKNKLVVRMIEHDIQEHNTHIQRIEQSSKNAIEEILETMNYLKGVFARTNPNMFLDMQRYHGDAWMVFRKFKEETIYKQVVQNIEKGREQDLYRKDFNVKIIARLRLEEIELGMNPMVYTADKFSTHEVQLQLMDHYLHGICTVKGHKLLNKYKQLLEDEG